ncbi:sel1 repeat family protein [Moraxella nasovis]|uniref:tetratricopeptide repeat protein n=1 Tax=Moraxella nasovis TaxID=2904121 RepID=UPI001F60174A|nr:tetratricopeptide repeat protein [Moraxella nasovis]UNU73861.1 sel1 repeat family protein [Moraxella nasovis]
MKLLKAVLLVGSLCTASLASAELTSNIPLNVSRFEMMDITGLTHLAQSGNHHAQFFLAMRLQKGKGVVKDAKKAAYWYTKAAEQGIAPAQLNLGFMYLKGEGVQGSMALGRTWLEKAARLGDNRASYALAMIDESQKRFVDAYKWYDLSGRDGMLDKGIRAKAHAKVGELALNLSSSQIQQAKTLATTWFQGQ